MQNDTDKHVIERLLRRLSRPYGLATTFTIIITLTVIIFTGVQFSTGSYTALQARMNLVVTPATTWLAIAMSRIRKEPTYREFIRNVFVLAVILTAAIGVVATTSGDRFVATEILGKQIGNTIMGFVLVILDRLNPVNDATTKEDA